MLTLMSRMVGRRKLLAHVGGLGIRLRGCALGAFSQSRDVDSGTRKNLLEIREAVWRAWYSDDQEMLNRLVPPYLIAIDPGGGDWKDRAATVAAARRFAEGGGKLHALNFPRTEIQINGDTAVLLSSYAVKWEEAGKTKRLTGRATEVFFRDKGHWVNTAWRLDSGR